jgi:hypothetical protein
MRTIGGQCATSASLASPLRILAASRSTDRSSSGARAAVAAAGFDRAVRSGARAPIHCGRKSPNLQSELQSARDRVGQPESSRLQRASVSRVTFPSAARPEPGTAGRAGAEAEEPSRTQKQRRKPSRRQRRLRPRSRIHLRAVASRTRPLRSRSAGCGRSTTSPIPPPRSSDRPRDRRRAQHCSSGTRASGGRRKRSPPCIGTPRRHAIARRIHADPRGRG